MDNKFYQLIFDYFNELFPEFKQSVKDWAKCQFDSEERLVRISLKNGCYIFFGTTKGADDKWVWHANLDMSDKTKLKLGVTREEE